MFEQFSNYPELEWTASTAPQWIGSGDEFPINPNLEDFTLVRFKNLRKQPKFDRKEHSKLMLIGSSRTNVFISGPDFLIDELLRYLPKYVGKTWIEIKNINFERNLLTCKNVYTPLCNQGISDDMDHKPVGLDGRKPELDFEKEDKICVKCEHYELKKE